MAEELAAGRRQRPRARPSAKARLNGPRPLSAPSLQEDLTRSSPCSSAGPPGAADLQLRGCPEGTSQGSQGPQREQRPSRESPQTLLESQKRGVFPGASGWPQKARGAPGLRGGPCWSPDATGGPSATRAPAQPGRQRGPVARRWLRVTAEGRLKTSLGRDLSRARTLFVRRQPGEGVAARGR